MDLMKVSFIIPTFNESKWIIQTLNQFKELDPSTYEVIITDNGSSDNTPSVVEDLVDKTVTIETERRTTIGECRNRGARVATGEILWFIDADVRIVNIRQVFDKIIHYFSKHPKCVGIALKVKIYKEEATFADNFWFGAVNTVNFVMNRFMKVGGVSGDCLILRKNVFEDLKGFNPILITSEDYELSHRVAKKGEIHMFRDEHIEMSSRRIRRDGWLKLIYTWERNWIKHCVMKRPDKSGEWEARR